jgi:predicted kinase
MFTTLHSFYTSKEWRDFRHAVIAERIAPDGVLYDEYSGKPLLHDYDIILHHKEPLTLQNVNDYSISLNPSNIMIVSIKSHNEIHARFGGYWNRKVYYIWGSPCSGKNTFVMQNKGAADLIIDMDAIWQAITGGAKYDKPDALKQNAFMLRDALLEQVKTRAGKWQTAYILSTEPRASVRNRICNQLGAEQIYIECTKEEALQRLHNDAERAAVIPQWTEYINNFFENLEGAKI